MTLRGFTLIELMVVISIVLILIVGAVAKYNEYSEKEKVRQAALKFMTDVRLAAAKATSGVKPSVCSTNTLTGYKLEFPVSCSNACYEVTPVCTPVSGTTLRVELANTVRVSSTNSSIYFLPVVGGTDLSSDATITFTGPTTYTETVTITKYGLVNR